MSSNESDGSESDTNIPATAAATTNTANDDETPKRKRGRPVFQSPSLSKLTDPISAGRKSSIWMTIEI